MKKSSASRKVHYVLSTHWDREWYESFQFYRYRLVQLFDRVIEGFKDGRLKGPFQTDGQSIVIEDYLEIRPEKRAEVQKLIKEGKFVVGPWYVLPDEFIVSAESHVRNIRIGREIVRDEYATEPSDAGFVCDLFGHISQMPQIFANFGINAGYVWRGITEQGIRHLIWEGADGTETVCFLYRGNGYGDFSLVAREAHKHYEKFDHADKSKKLDDYLKKEAAETQIDSMMIFDGCDHQEWDQQYYPVIAERLGKDVNGYTIVHTTLDEYQKEMMAQRAKIKTRLKGELREPGKVAGKDPHQIHGVLSSRIWIKQQNAHCETLLTAWAEPLNATATLALGTAWPKGYLDVAWRWLIQNHPHDSICGCSIDQVHEDMKYRFSQCRQIGERLSLQAERQIGASIKGDVGEKDLRVVVFNPLPVAIDEVVDLTLWIPEDYPIFMEFFGFGKKPAFRLDDAKDKELPYQRNLQAAHRHKWRIRDAHFPEGYFVNHVGVSLPLQIPANGYTTLTIRPTEDVKPCPPVRFPEKGALATAHNAMENEFLAVRVESNGSLTVTDKRAKQVYTDILTYEDRADIGDGWFHGAATNDQFHTSVAAGADVALVENGPNTAAFRIRTTLNVPAEFDFHTMTRSQRLVPMTIDTIVRLRKGADRLEVASTIENNADDHRVRVLFPTGARSDVYYTDTPFDVIERNVALRSDNHEYAELDVETRPMQAFCAIADGKRGLAVISTGQLEGCVRDLPERPIALTLFRGTRRTVGSDGEPNGQVRGTLQFRYFLKFTAGKLDRTALFNLGRQIAAGLQVLQLRAADQQMHRQPKALPPSAGLFTLEGDVVLTSAQMVDGALEVRFFNPNEKKAAATLSFDLWKPTKAAFVDFESKPVKAAAPKIEKGKVRIELAAKKIVTIRFTA